MFYFISFYSREYVDCSISYTSYMQYAYTHTCAALKLKTVVTCVTVATKYKQCVFKLQFDDDLLFIHLIIQLYLYYIYIINTYLNTISYAPYTFECVSLEFPIPHPDDPDFHCKLIIQKLLCHAFLQLYYMYSQLWKTNVNNKNIV